ncbi:unnamed protein product [Anisakis simplex]|uniref:PH domain-containing protein n=1 Tax=Anisakis simplex TaxID=6269 RepID=A0A0M3KC69_ANISI|nr:unnamed protein product [Anisakis simplex]
MPQSNSSASPTSTVSSPTTPTKRQAGFINKNSVSTYPVREKTQYFFSVNDQVHVLETADNKSRLQWLRKLQSNRRRHYERENVDDILKVEIVSLSSHSGENNEQEQQRCGDDQKAENDNTTGVDYEGRVAGDDPSGLTGAEQAQEVVVPGPSDEKSLEEELFEATQSTFYLNSNGELNAKSLEMPSPMPPSTEILKNAEEVLVKIADETKALEVPAKRVISKARSSFRFYFLLLNLNGRDPPKSPESVNHPYICSVNISSAEEWKCVNFKQNLRRMLVELKDRCYELTDEVGANQDMVTVLRQTLIKANHQIEILKTMAELKSARDRVNFILERESEVIALQLNAAEHNREVRNLKQHIKELEERNNELNMAVEAFRDSVRTKEELIMKLCREQDLDASIINDVDVPEGILVDIGNPNGLDDGAQRVFDETAVNDVNEMRDLVEGYKNQNMFLNQEVLELQRIVQSLEERERRIIRQNFDIEACYYQLKSRYIMVLNHFKEDAPSTSARDVIISLKKFDISFKNCGIGLLFRRHIREISVLEPGVIEELIDETNWTAEKRTLANDKTELRVTDSLGFYLDNDANTRRRRQTSSDLLDVAVKLQEKTNKIIGQQRLVSCFLARGPRVNEILFRSCVKLSKIS